MTWVRTNVPVGSNFLLLTGSSDPFSDPVQEWFPVFSERVSLSTVQGREWSLGADFIGLRDDVNQLQRCLNADPGCVEQWAAAQDLSYEYLYLLMTPIPSVSTGARNPMLLSHLLRTSSGYDLVYESNDVEIFAHHSSTP